MLDGRIIWWKCPCLWIPPYAGMTPKIARDAFLRLPAQAKSKPVTG
jgi:hypothetical protein